MCLRTRFPSSFLENFIWYALCWKFSLQNLRLQLIRMLPYSVYFEIKHQKWSTCVSLQSQIQKQGKEICQLREIVSEFGQAGTPPSTPSRVQQLPLPGKAVYTQPTCHVSPPMYGRLSAYEYQQPCYPTPSKTASPIQIGNGILPQCPALMANPSAPSASWLNTCRNPTSASTGLRITTPTGTSARKSWQSTASNIR